MVINELIYDGSNTKLMVKVGNDIVKVLVYSNDYTYEIGQEINMYWDIEDVVIFGDNNEE